MHQIWVCLKPGCPNPMDCHGLPLSKSEQCHKLGYAWQSKDQPEIFPVANMFHPSFGGVVPDERGRVFFWEGKRHHHCQLPIISSFAAFLNL